MLYDWITQIEFAFPLAFGLFILLPFLVIWYRKKTIRPRERSMCRPFTHLTWIPGK